MTSPIPLRRCTRMLAALAALSLGGCGRAPKLEGTGRVLVRMTDWQQPWFEEQLSGLARSEGVALEVRSYQRVSDVEGALRDAARERQIPVLVKVDGRLLPRLQAAGLLRPLEDVVAPGQLADDLDVFLPAAVGPARFEGKTWGVPRKREVMVLAYRPSSVRLAVSAAPTQRAAFRTQLQASGLSYPEGRELESDPAEWDLVDLLEVAYCLARVPIGGSITPRFAHRTADVEGTPSDFACFVYPLGDPAASGPGGLAAAPGFAPFLALQRFLLSTGSVPGLEGGGLHTPELIEGWGRGDYHLGFFHQLDAWFLAGALDVTGEGSDLAFAPLPAGGPWGMDGTSRAAPTGGWWWCLPAGGPDPALGYRLALALNAPARQEEEVRRFGILPVRRDLAEDVAVRFSDPRLQNLLTVSLTALAGGATKPFPDPEGDGVWERWKEGLRP